MAAADHDVNLDEVLDFMGLLWAIEHLLKSTSKLTFKRTGLTGPQRLVLRIVEQRPGIAPSELVTLIHLHKSTLTGILRRLEHRRLLVRVRDDRDRRRTKLLPADSRRTADASAPTLESAVTRVLPDLKPHELRATRRALTRIVDVLETQVTGLRTTPARSRVV
jgi:DNA-binding MarR family transcriptional regulator